MNAPQLPDNSAEQHLTKAIRDQIQVISEHMSGDRPLCAQFVRDHALIVLQLSEALRESVHLSQARSAS